MDPVTIGAVLLAIAGGTAGDASAELWEGVRQLVRRPPVWGGEAEFAGLEQAPFDQSRAVALAEALLARGDADPEFREQLEGWWRRASEVLPGEGNVANVISGGIQYGPVLQGRDFSGLTFDPAPGSSRTG